MIFLHHPGPAWGLPSMSPFCVKLETYLRMAGLKYQNASGTPVGAPKGKIPYIKIEGEALGDSSHIIDHLKAKYGDALDHDLNPEQKALGLAIQRLVEEHFYFAGAWLRWNNPDSAAHVKKLFRGFLPPVIGGLIFAKIKKDFNRDIFSQGMGRHRPEEILAFAKEDISALAALLGEKKFFLGDEPRSVDACVYGFLVQQIHVPWQNELNEFVRGHKNLVEYDQRMKARYWS